MPAVHLNERNVARALKEARLVSLLSSRVGLFDRSLLLRKQRDYGPACQTQWHAMAAMVSYSVLVGDACAPKPQHQSLPRT